MRIVGEYVLLTGNTTVLTSDLTVPLRADAPTMIKHRSTVIQARAELALLHGYYTASVHRRDLLQMSKYTL